LVCTGSKCKEGSEELIECFKEQIKKHDMKRLAAVLKTHCTGNCKHAPVFSIQPANKWFFEARIKDAKRAFKRFVVATEVEAVEDVVVPFSG
jgi:NADH:ubiquinone oxidoreductase subunit E